MTIYGGPEIVTDGLVLHLDAANTKSYSGNGTDWNDLSGNNSNAILTNGATFDSNNRGSIVFDGTNDFITTVEGQVFYQYNTQITACVWIKRNGTIKGGSGGGQSTKDVDNWNSTNVWLFHGNENNTIIFYVNANNNGVYYNRSRVTPVLDDNRWYFICGTCSSSLIKIYVNGYLSGSGATGINTGTIVNNSNSVVQYGKDPRYASSRFFNGSVAANYLYNRELSAKEILQNYNATKGRYGL